MTLERIEFENFKTFEKEFLDMKEIIFLLGKNSAGKSSLVHLFLLLLQTYSERTVNTALNLNGKYVNLGEPKNIFHNHDVSKTIKINLFFTDTINTTFLDQLEDSESYEKFQILNLITRIRKKIPEITITDYFNVHDSNLSLPTIRKMKKILLDSSTDDLNLEELESCNELINYNVKALKDMFEFKKEVLKLGEKKIQISMEYIYKNDDIFLKKFALKTADNETLIGIEYNRNKFKFVSDVYNLHDKYNILLKKTDTLPIGINEVMNVSDEKYTGLYNMLSSIHLTSYNYLVNNFSKNNIKYISPLRAIPKRHYTIENTLDEDWNTFNSDQVAKLLKLNPKIIDTLNLWLKKLGISIQGASNIKGSLYSLLVKQKKLSLDLNDVGFGISQVLPILLNSLLSNENAYI